MNEITIWPEIKEVKQIENDCLMQLTVPNNLLYFDGHFPTKQILPGVVQIDWAIFYAKKYFHITKSFSSMKLVKFQQIIEPNQTVELKLSFNPEKQMINFKYSSTIGLHSSGNILFG